MSWADRILSIQDLQPFTEAANQALDHLPVQVRALLLQQQATWPQLREALAGLQQVENKHWQVQGVSLRTQFNPMRMVSTGAKVDATSIAQRPCFLCVANLPPAEKGIPFADDFVILANPFPVLPDHLVIAHRSHTPQQIQPQLAAFLQLTKALGTDFFTLYNGPRCGASAPDHLHFQACQTSALPLFTDADAWFPASQPNFVTRTGVAVGAGQFNLLQFQSADADNLLAVLNQALILLNGLQSEATDEPLLNVLAHYREATGWQVILIPRQKHRPACYFAAAPDQLLVSPAALDLAGVVVVPHPEHFQRITAATLAEIFAEVLLDDVTFNNWIAQLRNS